MNVSKAGREILKQIANGNATADQFTGGQARAVAALRRGKLITVKAVKVDGLALSDAGKELLSGKSEGGSRRGRRSSAATEGHRDGSKASQAAKIIARFGEKLARGDLIKKLVKEVGLTENSASTYIYNYGKNH